MTETLLGFDQRPSTAQLRRHTAPSGVAEGLRVLFAGDAERFTHLSCQADGLLLDYSKQRITPTILTSLFELSFAANIDEVELGAPPLIKARPKAALFILASKSFSTAESLSNASIARRWLATRLDDSADLHCHRAAISNNAVAAEAFGVHRDAVFPLPEWVGGRLSVWSAIGLPRQSGQFHAPDAFNLFSSVVLPEPDANPMLKRVCPPPDHPMGEAEGVYGTR